MFQLKNYDFNIYDHFFVNLIEDEDLWEVMGSIPIKFASYKMFPETCENIKLMTRG